MAVSDKVVHSILLISRFSVYGRTYDAAFSVFRGWDSRSCRGTKKPDSGMNDLIPGRRGKQDKGKKSVELS
jgi:hypothetical protein